MDLYHYNPPQRECWASSGDGNGTGAEPGAGTGTPPTPPDWEKFMATLQDIPGAVRSEMARSVEQLQTLNQRVEGLTPKEETPTPPNFDEMGNADIVAFLQGHINTTIQEAIKTALEPIAQDLIGVRTELTQSNGKVEVERLRGQHKDLSEWKDEMISLAQAHPTLDIPSLYKLARANNGDKAKTLDTKYNPPVEKPRPFAFTGGLTAPAGAGRNQLLDKATAVRAAASEVNSRHPGVLAALRDL